VARNAVAATPKAATRAAAPLVQQGHAAVAARARLGPGAQEQAGQIRRERRWGLASHINRLCRGGCAQAPDGTRESGTGRECVLAYAAG